MDAESVDGVVHWSTTLGLSIRLGLVIGGSWFQEKVSWDWSKKQEVPTANLLTPGPENCISITLIIYIIFLVKTVTESIYIK